MIKDVTYEGLSKCPEWQPEAIAKHYVSQATMGLHLLKLIEARKGCGISLPDYAQWLDEAISFCVTEIKRSHAHDLGIALEWRKPNA